MRFTIHQNSRNGGRPSNQDRVAYSYSKQSLLMVLADGMGGYLHGDVAAQLAVKMLTDAFQRKAQPLLDDVQDFLLTEINKIQDAIHQLAHNQGLEETPKTTLVVAVLQNNRLVCAHIGDSRLYHFRQHQCIFTTEDHSVVQALLKQGTLAPDDVAAHPDRNKVYNCLGGDIPPTIDISPARRLHSDDTIMLCSDGLWAYLSADRMVEILDSGRGMPHFINSMLDIAEQIGGAQGDNLSAIGVQWEDILDQDLTLSGLTTALDQARTIIQPLPDESLSELSHDDIERAIAEINVAIQRSKR